MSLVRYFPSRNLNWRHNPVNSLVNDFLSSELYSDTRTESPLWCPRVEVDEKEKEYAIEFELPGLSKDDVKLSVEKNVLTVSGERASKEDSKNDHYHYSERSYGKFERSFTLPENTKDEDVKANFKNGVLTVSIPKSKEAEPKTIEIK
ncbi:Hsp20/alpha crystallin family protein [candidate division KSB1 bacterium]